MATEPRQIADVLAELMARRGYARVLGVASYEEAWRNVCGDFIATTTRVGKLRRGRLEVFVANSALLQELTFQKDSLLQRLTALLPDQGITDLRFRVGRVQ
jgi:predicted nucleic acid-binding Zn ribbon protein